ncbi:hypothetical protein APHAL10511_004142 [Amanita phalloides]|nr:hypothetical protein APHAL10511_004142 [Amanita phalloides]
MDVDTPAPPVTTHHISLIDGVPQQDLNNAYEQLAQLVRRNDDDRIRTSLGLVWTIVREALKQDPYLREYLASKEIYRANIKRIGENKFIRFLRELANEENLDSWKRLLEHDVFLNLHRPDRSGRWYDEPEVQESIHATLESWKTEFKGNAADVLLATISEYLNKDLDVHARLAPIINSSGTGKSRIVDELSKEIITLPTCLRAHGSDGFPPPDDNIRDWLFRPINLRSKDSSAKSLHAFVHSLLCVTLETLKSIAEHSNYPITAFPFHANDIVGHIPKSGKNRQRALASAFRELLTKGYSFWNPSTDRVKFYTAVMMMANKFVERSQQSPPQYVFDGNGIREAGEELCKLVDPSGVLDANAGPRRPLIIIYFDEYYRLVDEPPYQEWSLFSELQRVLAELVKLPIFVLFISTSGKIHLRSPKLPLHPISEISFDDVMLSSTEGVNLDQVVQMDWISHLGRPLFGTRYDDLPSYINDVHVMAFAKEILLCGEVSGTGILACLLVRFGLEINRDDDSSRMVALTQVERHMRLCLAATSDFQHLVTISGSEPLLAEAARIILRETLWSPAYHLLEYSKIDYGRRGELVAALLIMQARDKAAYETGSRWIAVSDFMEALLPTAAHDELQQSLPRIWRDGENKSFYETFEDYGMWFNHIIKVEDGEMISANHLCEFIKRGAMIMFKDAHYDIDLVLPVCDVNTNISPDTVTAILVKVKNDKNVKDNIQLRMFNAMNPFTVGLFDDERLPLPIIQVVFALASPTSAIRIPAPLPHGNPNNHTAFGVWCAGLKDTFSHIDKDMYSYENLLDHFPKSLDIFDLAEISDVGLAEETKAERGCQRRKMAALVRSEEMNDQPLLAEETETKSGNTEKRKSTMTPEGDPQAKTKKRKESQTE